MVIGVADYAVTKTYDEMELSFVDDFTVTAHSGAYDTEMNTVQSVQAAWITMLILLNLTFVKDLTEQW